MITNSNKKAYHIRFFTTSIHYSDYNEEHKISRTQTRFPYL